MRGVFFLAESVESKCFCVETVLGMSVCVSLYCFEQT